MSGKYFQVTDRYVTFDDVDPCTMEDSKCHKMQHISSKFQQSISNKIKLCMNSELRAQVINTCTTNK